MGRSLIALALFIGLASERSVAGADAKRPNILLIYADDQSYKTVGCYPTSYPWVKTPNIDALAASGVRFSGAYLGSWCMPSRATLLTGRLPHGIESMSMEGVYPGSTYDPAKCPFWPKVFRAEGYHTAQIGKWHTGTDAGYGRDWDYQIVWNRPKHPDNAGAYYETQRLAINGEERDVPGYSTDNYSKWAAEYIRGEHRDAAKPWFLWLCYGAVHGPAKPAPRHKGHYAGNNVPAPADIFGPRPGKPSYLDKTQAWTRGPGGVPVLGKSGEAFGDDSEKNPRTYSQWVQQVNECAMALDEGVGTVLQSLKESGQLENTLVVYTADQGFGMGEHGFRTKLGPYEATFRSPLIISQSGTIPMGKVCPHGVGGPDLAVTFFQRAGLKLPWTMHGRDISPLLADPERTDWSHPVLFEHCGQSYGSDVAKILRDTPEKAVHNNVPWWIALRHGKDKYIRTLAANEPEELYDLATDPEELVNLAGQSEHQPRLARLRAMALDELRRTEAGDVDRLPRPTTMTE
ncbi:MAG TPA: sulfatase-like hydrolase/transferase [Planctomycetaceae bacterium]|nr:sulfatase-like hydrolase/transferase [Planctomycetaceae bacterium]